MSTIESSITAKALMQATISSTLLKKAFEADQDFADEMRKAAIEQSNSRPAPEVKTEPPPPEPAPRPESSQSIDITV